MKTSKRKEEIENGSNVTLFLSDFPPLSLSLSLSLSQKRERERKKIVASKSQVSIRKIELSVCVCESSIWNTEQRKIKSKEFFNSTFTNFEHFFLFFNHQFSCFFPFSAPFGFSNFFFSFSLSSPTQRV